MSAIIQLAPALRKKYGPGPGRIKADMECPPCTNCSDAAKCPAASCVFCPVILGQGGFMDRSITL